MKGMALLAVLALCGLGCRSGTDFSANRTSDVALDVCSNQAGVTVNGRREPIDLSGDEDDVARRVAEQLRAKGAQAITVRSACKFAEASVCNFCRHFKDAGLEAVSIWIPAAQGDERIFKCERMLVSDCPGLPP